MTTDTDRISAKIYDFPARGRFAVATQRDEAKPLAYSAAPRARVVMGGAWYHDEAIQEGERKN